MIKNENDYHEKKLLSKMNILSYFQKQMKCAKITLPENIFHLYKIEANMISFRTLFLISIVLVLISGFATRVNAQSQRMILVEEATNASCGPCAAQNPTFEHYLNLQQVKQKSIPLVYHWYYPGQDVMYAAEPTMNNSRVSYYGINGVPTAVVNGKIPQRINSSYDGSPADTVAITNAIKKYSGDSPISIQINEQVNGSNASVDVIVSSTTAISGKKLRIAVTEGHHYYANAGTNGEKDFYYTARKMLPNYTGIDLTLNANESKTFSQAFTIDASWNADQIYVIAFVQDDGTKEVLQAGTDKVNLIRQMHIALNKTQNDSKNFIGTIVSPVGGDFIVSINNTLPSGWTSEVKIGETIVTTGSKIAFLKDIQNSLSVNITPASSKNRLGQVQVILNGSRATSLDETFKLYSPNITALLMVKDEEVDQIAINYQQAFEQGTVNYAFVTNDDEQYFDLTTYSVIVYEVGKNVLYQKDIDKLKTFFNRGGRMYMIGAEIAWGLADPGAIQYGTPNDINFMHQFLHADYIADSNPNATVNGIAGDPIGNGLSFSIKTGVQNQDTPDQIAARSGAIPFLYYGTNQNQIAGIRYADARNRLVYLGFGLEGIGTLSQRTEILKRGIAWLLGSEVTEVGNNQNISNPNMFNIYPNPVKNEWTLPIYSDRNQHVRISIYDMTGRYISTLTDQDVGSGTTNFRFNSLNIPSGTYMIHCVIGNQITSQMMRVVQ